MRRSEYVSTSWKVVGPWNWLEAEAGAQYRNVAFAAEDKDRRRNELDAGGGCVVGGLADY